MTFQNSIDSFLQELSHFEYGLSSKDHVWNILFPYAAVRLRSNAIDKWTHIHINNYRQVYFISQYDERDTAETGLEVEPGKSVKPLDTMGTSASRNLDDDSVLAAKWKPLIAAARKWLGTVRRDWIKANKKVQLEYPLNRRYGIVQNCLIRNSLPDIYRLDRELGKMRSRKLVRLVEEGFFMRSENTERATMTAGDYFSYCKIAYPAGKRKGEKVDTSLSGREMYKLYADRRHEGLLDIDETSEQEFADWLDGKHPKRITGGHPWEIKRGGNTTHINLSVRRPSFHQNKSFIIELQGASMGRMVETMKMFLAIHKASLPISIYDPEGVRKRLLGQDNIGIIPNYSSLHRANQHFRKEQDVYDVLHYDDLGRYKRRITPFIRWEPLPILKPRDF